MEKSRTESVMLAVAAVVPAVAALIHAENVADAAHDGGVIRTVGLGWDGPWHALDAWAAAPFLLLPIGTQTFRAAMASAVACGAAGAVLYQITRALLAACAQAPRLGPVVAAIASLMASLSMAWQIEALAPGGATVAALLGLLAVVAANTVLRERQLGRVLGLAALGVLIVPPALSFVRRARSPLVLRVPPLSSWFAGPVRSPLEVAHEQLGWLALALSLAGLVLALREKRARTRGLTLLGFAALGAVSLYAGSAVGPTRFGAFPLLGLAALAAFAGVAIQALVRAVAAAKVPFARASAAMIVLLAVAFPVVTFDETALRCEARMRSARAPWPQVMFGHLPARAMLLVSDPRFAEHLFALRAGGLLRPDLAVVPAVDLGSRAALRELAREPKLAPFFRDMALGGAPGEWSLTSVASERPLFVFFQPEWDRTIARHLVPSGAFDRFHAEPRGTVERKRALEAFSPERQALAGMLVDDLDLRALTATPLRARGNALSATRERDLLAHADEDTRAIDPSTPPRSSVEAPTR